MKKQDKIISEFQQKAIHVFGHDLIFAFIFGSYARSKNLRKINDIDMFILLNRIDPQKANRFKRWYLEIHRKYNLIPDRKYFYEIMNEKKLDEYLKIMEKTRPQFHIKKISLFDAIIWANALCSDYIAFTGNYKKFLFFRKKSKKIVDLWIYQLLEKMKKMPSIFFKQNVFYHR